MAYGSLQPPVRGWDSVTVPGAVAGWVELSRRFGKLGFADLLAPAIDIAERGYAVPVVVQQKWAAAVPDLQRSSRLCGSRSCRAAEHRKSASASHSRARPAR